MDKFIDAPKKYDEVIRVSIAIECIYGFIVLGLAKDGAIRGISIGKSPMTAEVDFQVMFPNAKLVNDVEASELCVHLVAWLAGNQAVPFMRPLKLIGTPFQKKVWRAVKKIPFGETLTYGEVAEKIGAPTAVRAVASAIGANVLAFAIPCHRVLPKSGGYGDYRWGKSRKLDILHHEAVTSGATRRPAKKAA